MIKNLGQTIDLFDGAIEVAGSAVLLSDVLLKINGTEPRHLVFIFNARDGWAVAHEVSENNCVVFDGPDCNKSKKILLTGNIEVFHRTGGRRLA